MKDQFRRWKRVYISPNVLLDILNGNVIALRHPDLPDGFTLLNPHWDYSTHMLAAIIEHESFEPVSMGEMIPELGPLEYEPIPRRSYVRIPGEVHFTAKQMAEDDLGVIATMGTYILHLPR